MNIYESYKDLNEYFIINPNKLPIGFNGYSDDVNSNEYTSSHRYYCSVGTNNAIGHFYTTLQYCLNELKSLYNEVVHTMGISNWSIEGIEAQINY